jgi:hypothetical protein
MGQYESIQPDLGWLDRLDCRIPTLKNNYVDVNLSNRFSGRSFSGIKGEILKVKNSMMAYDG